jgi:putative spermidine/putrescine transport system substrate-binding protein
MEWNQGILKLSWWGIPKGAKHYKEAMKLIEFMMQPKYQLEWIKLSDYTGASKKAVELIDPKVVNPKFLATSPENIKKQFLQNADWWLDNADKVEDRWQSWIIK